jgi:hypothetical protein
VLRRLLRKATLLLWRPSSSKSFCIEPPTAPSLPETRSAAGSAALSFSVAALLLMGAV